MKVVLEEQDLRSTGNDHRTSASLTKLNMLSLWRDSTPAHSDIWMEATGAWAWIYRTGISFGRPKWAVFWNFMQIDAGNSALLRVQLLIQCGDVTRRCEVSQSSLMIKISFRAKPQDDRQDPGRSNRRRPITADCPNIGTSNYPHRHHQLNPSSHMAQLLARHIARPFRRSLLY